MGYNPPMEANLELEWYVATVILKCEITGVSSVPGEWTCTQQIFIIRAPNNEIAYSKAIEIGKLQETTYQNMDGAEVTWCFIGLENLELLTSKRIRDGIEIWGRVFHSSNPDALVVERGGLSVFYDEDVKELTAREILQEGIKTKLVCNRVKL